MLIWALFSLFALVFPLPCSLCSLPWGQPRWSRTPAVHVERREERLSPEMRTQRWGKWGAAKGGLRIPEPRDLTPALLPALG